MKNLAPAIFPPKGIGDAKPGNAAVLDWVNEIAALTEPENIFWCDGSDRENEFLIAESMKQNVLIELNQKKVSRCYLHRSDPNDVARVEQFTIVCTPTKEEAGPTNNWSEPRETYAKLRRLLRGAMHGRTMFVIPYMMGPADSPLTKVGKIPAVGEDIAWMGIRDGRLYAVNPENGYFGVVPGTSYKSNPNAMRSIAHDTVYTNVALTDDGDVWWEGKDGPPPAHALDWRGDDWTPESKEKAAHPNSRFTTPVRNNPALDFDIEKGEGVPISAIIFGGRRSDTVPLVYQAFDWNHGVYLGATMASETTAAAAGAVGRVRRDPMAMLPFCGYNIGDYFQHWLDMGKRLTNPPLIFNVNWFRKGADGKFLWPGFGENMRVLKWIIDRCERNGGAVESPVGWLPSPHDLDLAELDIDHNAVDELLGLDHEEWQKEIAAHKEFFDSLGRIVPKELQKQREQLATRFEP